MWLKSEIEGKLHNLDYVHTVEVIKKGTKYYVIALFEGSTVGGHVNLGDSNVAQLTTGKTQDEALNLLRKIVRGMGMNVMSLEAARKAGGDEA